MKFRYLTHALRTYLANSVIVYIAAYYCLKLEHAHYNNKTFNPFIAETK